MITRINGFNTFAISAAFATAIGCLLPMTASAQNSSIIHRHPNATGVAAGAAAYHVAKHSGNKRAATGRHRNFVQRHPIATGVAAGMAAKHIAKHH